MQQVINGKENVKSGKDGMPRGAYDESSKRMDRLNAASIRASSEFLPHSLIGRLPDRSRRRAWHQ
ncbi:hypothetical protein [Butyricicoccus sp. Marseille-Q5471]|uniref:hypothetical protein n=1 Tax=Butyricicoccus sp. Marseille-Q5471 TaxID=3039493 RepID=UPI0024BCC944|nr:hypothetical protein [Butyricicoccus sp. Marseille-Q5471]